jgi:hypothetical protein
MLTNAVEAHGQKNVPREVWEYVDWQIREVRDSQIREGGDIESLYRWDFIVFGKRMATETVREKINKAVQPLEQNFRSQGTSPAFLTRENSDSIARREASSRPLCKELPRDWDVRVVRRSMYIFYSTTPWRIDRYLDLFPLFGQRPLSLAPILRFERETLDVGDLYQEHESSPASAAASSVIPMDFEPMAASVFSAVSVNGESSWNPKNELFQSLPPQSYEFMKGSPMSTRQSSVKSTRLSAMKALSSSMRSIQL